MATDTDRIAALERRVRELERKTEALEANDPKFAAGTAEAIDLLITTLVRRGVLPPEAFETALQEKLGRIRAEAHRWPQVAVLHALLPADRPRELDRSSPPVRPGQRGQQRRDRA